MTTAPHEREQGNVLNYDFYRPDLWLTRFFSLNDAVSSAFNAFESALTTINGATIDRVEKLIHDAGRIEQENLKTLLIFLPQLHVLNKGSVLMDSPGASSPDLEFELKQLLNLYTFCCNLRRFVDGTLYTAVHALWENRPAQTLPPTPLVRACMQRVSIDVEIIQGAINQRRWGMVSDGSYQISPQGKALLVTDKLAWKALAPYQHMLPVDGPVIPITFFSRNTYIHHTPYSDHLLLIGIGYDHISLGASSVAETMRRGGYANNPELLKFAREILPAFELMAIPHEVGHYIYHHAKLDSSHTFADLSEQFAGHPYHQWCEEIFADTYGCIVSGPLMALGLQALLAASDDHTICVNDGEHPTALLRPFFLSEILRVLHDLAPAKYPFLKEMHHLNKNWAAILQSHGYGVIGENSAEGNCIIQTHDAEINVAEAVAAVQEIILAFAQPLLALAQIEPWDAPEPGNLSVNIPWVQNNHNQLNDYDLEMAMLSNGDFIGQRVPGFPLAKVEQSRVNELHQLLAEWGDKGPDSGGGSIGTLRVSEPTKSDKNSNAKK